MACPKVNPNYPNTARLVARPFGVLVRRIDPDFDRDRRFDLAYVYGRRKFVEDSLLHGAYQPIPGIDFNTDFGLGYDSTQALTAAQQDAGYLMEMVADPVTGETYGDQIIQTVDAQFRADNGFCNYSPDLGGDFSDDFAMDGALFGVPVTPYDVGSDTSTDFDTIGSE